jgi:uncharacterized protein YukE
LPKYRINYSATVNKAEKLKELSRNLFAEIQELEILRETIRTEWCGNASDAYCRKLQMLTDTIYATKYKLDSLSWTIETVANRIQQEDEARARQEEERIRREALLLREEESDQTENDIYSNTWKC